MAQFNEVLEFQLNELLTRRLAMQGGSPAPSLGPEISPAIILENDRVEWACLRSEGLWSFQAEAVTEAAQQSWIRLINPAGSNVVATVEYFHAVCASAWLVVSGGLFPTLTEDVAITPFPRWAAAPTAAPARAPRTPLLPSTGDTAAVTAAVGAQLRFPATTAAQACTVPFVLYPGNGILWYNIADNETIQVSASWRERQLVRGELG